MCAVYNSIHDIYYIFCFVGLGWFLERMVVKEPSAKAHEENVFHCGKYVVSFVSKICYYCPKSKAFVHPSIHWSICLSVNFC